MLKIFVLFKILHRFIARIKAKTIFTIHKMDGRKKNEAYRIQIETADKVSNSSCVYESQIVHNESEQCYFLKRK